MDSLSSRRKGKPLPAQARVRRTATVLNPVLSRGLNALPLPAIAFGGPHQTEPPNIYEAIEPYLPFIFAMWHGQHFLAPLVPLDRPNHRAKVLISRHRDAEINAIAPQKLGIGTIRGSGDQGVRFDRKGGVGAFVAMLDALKEGYTVAVTADVPKIPRVAGEGIVRLAALSGRPLIAVALAGSRRIELNTWDRAALNLPFSRIALVGGPPNQVPSDADAATIEQYRVKLEADLNAATNRAYALVL